jgi:small subunit ribosomal protein S20
MRTSERSRHRNRAVKSRVKNAIKAYEQATTPEEMDSRLRAVTAELDRAVRKGVLPGRRVDRKKSRLARSRDRAVAAASTASDAAS